MSLVRAVVTFHHISGLPKDDVQNVWHFGTDPGGITTAISDDIIAKLKAFYQDAPTNGGVGLVRYLSGELNRTPGYDIDIYVKEIGEKDFGSPVDLDHGIAYEAEGAATNLPAETALAVSFHGNLADVPEEVGTTRPAARKRGRIFLGPLCASAQGAAGHQNVHRPFADFVAAAANRANVLRLASDGVATWSWGVAHAASTANWTFTNVVGGWVDNEWDTIRRRGHAATARTLF